MDHVKMRCPFVAGGQYCAWQQKLANIHFFSRVCISQIEISGCVCRYDSVCGSIRTNQVFATVQGAYI
jgi:C4-type Zn-finger protein